MRAELSKIQPIDLVIASLQTGVVLMFLILLGNSIIYGVGILLGGTGLVFHFLGAMLRVQIVTYLVLGIMLALLWFGGLESSGANDIGPIVTGLSFILLLIASFVSFVAHVIIAGRANETGIAKGLLSVVIGGMIVGFLVSTLRVLG